MKIESTKAWSCNGGETVCSHRPLSCLHPPSRDCKPVRIYPEMDAKLLEREHREFVRLAKLGILASLEVMKIEAAWAKGMKGKVRG